MKTNENEAAAASYDDLATFIRVINGVGLPGGDGRFNTDAFRAEVEQVFDAQAFLRWAGVNLLLGSWDNYFASPANYYLYNGGHAGRARDFATGPYFTFLPWDYDNCLGIDYFGTKWQCSLGPVPYMSGFAWKVACQCSRWASCIGCPPLTRHPPWS